MSDDKDPDITAYARAQNWLQLSDPDRNQRPGIIFTRIIDHANRAPGDALDLDVERHIRTNDDAKRFYFQLLDVAAAASSPVSLAASGARVTRRVLGQNILKLARESSGIYLTIEMQNPGSSRYELEARSPDADGVRVPIGAAYDGIISIRLDPRFPELEALTILLEDPNSSLWLLRIRGEK